MNRFIARRQNSDETITLVMTVSNVEKLADITFLKQLKQAINTYITYNENGRKVLEYSGGDFNFGDLAVIAEDSSFINIAAKYRLFDFKVELIQNNQDDFNFDTNLTK